MKLTLLVDNNTFIDRYFQAEPGFSVWLECEGTTILFDTGYSDLFLRNAAKLGIPATQARFVVLSHSHVDHTWGLHDFVRAQNEAFWERGQAHRPTLIAHPDVLGMRREVGCVSSGLCLSEAALRTHFELSLSREPCPLTSRITFLGAIPRRFPFEGKETFGLLHRPGGEAVPDTIPEDSALAIHTDAGLVIVTGCAHSGICNTVEHAREVCGERRVRGIVGGLHLQNASRERLDGTARYLESLKLPELHACHCTDLQAKIQLARVAPLRECGVGLTLEF